VDSNLSDEMEAEKNREAEQVATAAEKLARMLLMVDDQSNDLTELYLKTLIDHGIKKNDNPPKKILIIGAGMAGLVAGTLLKNAGHEVTLLEANTNRIGGRIKTFRYDDSMPSKKPFKDLNQYAEAGAMRIPDFHPLTLALIDKLELPRQLFFNVDVNPESGNQKAPVPPVVYKRLWDSREVWRNGNHETAFKTPDQNNNAWIRTNNEQNRKKDYINKSQTINKGFEVFINRTVGSILNEALDAARNLYSFFNPKTNQRENKPFPEFIEGWTELIKNFDQFSMRRFLKEKSGLSETLLQAIGTIENLTSRMPISFIHSFLGRAVINPSVTYWEIVGGMWRLPYALAANLKENIVLDARMIDLEYYDPKRADASYEHVSSHGSKVWVRTISEPDPDESFSEAQKHKNERYFEADLAVITVPFSSLRFVTVNPSFSYGKRRAIIELHYDAATKVLLEFTKRWWEFSEEDWKRELGDEFEAFQKFNQSHGESQAYPIFGGGSVTDGPNRFIYYPSHKVESSEGGIILASYTWADDARRWDSIPDSDRYHYALKGLKEIHGKWIERFWVGYENSDEPGGQTQSWSRNFYAFGEAAVFAPGQFTLLHPSITSTEGPVHFAGEHTSLKHAWVEGAIESGVRAALEMHERK